MNLALILATVKFLSEHGSDLAAAGAEVAGLWQFLQSHRSHPGLTDAQRAELSLILAVDPRSIGVGPVEVPPTPVPVPADEIYGVTLHARPPDSALKAGDHIYRTPFGQYFIVPRGIGISIPADWVLEDVMI